MTIVPVPTLRHDTVSLPGGRRLAWKEWGPGDGAPIIFCTGAGMSGSLGFGWNDLDRLGLRLIAIDRPGLGASDPHPDKTLASWADDVGMLIAAAGLDRPLAVGFSQGAPFALALAATARVEAVAVVAGQDDLGHPALAHLLEPQVAGMVAAARADPKGFAAEVAAVASADWLWDLVIKMSADIDRELYCAPEFMSFYRACLQEGFSQGAEGYARDLAIALGEWPFAVEEIAVPVDLWFGGRDTSPVHSPDLGASLAARLPIASRKVDPAAGGSLLWRNAEAILATLAARRRQAPC